jgi:long-chain acyl-CoA synthetase
VKPERVDEIGFWNIARKHPDRLAIVNPDRREVSAGELLDASNQLANGMHDLGLTRGDSIAVLVPNDAVFFELYLAATQIGLYVTPINYNLTSSEIAYIVDDCEAKIFIASDRFAAAAIEAADSIGFPHDGRFAVGQIEGFRPYPDLKSADASTPADQSVGLEQWYTSGTTGRPKGVRRALPEGHPDDLGEIAASRQVFGDMPRGEGVHILTSTVYHGGPQSSACASLHLGQALVLMNRFDAETFLELVDRYHVTSAFMVPTMFVRLLGLPEEVKRKYDLSSLGNIVHSAAPCPPEVKQQMLDWWGPVIYEYYAATEGGGTYVTPQDWLKHPGTVGRAFPGAEVRIFDDDGIEVGPGITGNVYMKSITGTFDYFKDPDKTKDSHRHGLFTVGDVGYLDEDGWLFLTERKPDIIIAGGVNIYPAEIEAVLVTHPSVGDAAVIGVPDDERGEQVKALIETVAGVSGGPELQRELDEFCHARLASYKCPRSYEFRGTLNRTEAGKLQRRLLREPFWVGRDRRM